MSFLRFWLSLVLLLALEAHAAVRKTARSEHGWERWWIAPRDGEIRLHIALRQKDDGREVEKHLVQRSDPNSPYYRDHMDAAQVAYLSEPILGSAHAVESWLWQHDLLRDATLFGGIYEIETTIPRVEKLLNTTYFVFFDGIQELVRTELYYIPDSVAGYIDFVTPTTTFPKAAKDKLPKHGFAGTTAQKAARAQSLNARADCGADSQVTPTCVRQIYEIDYSAKPDRTKFGVYGTEAASFSASDLQTYLSRYNKEAAAANPTYEIVGDGDPDEGSDPTAKFEVALDTQTALGLAWPAQGVFYNLGGVFGPNKGKTYDNFVQFLHEMAANKTVPSVVSFSESMPEDMMDPGYAKRLCNMMARVGLRGVSLLFSTGDNGPNGDQPTGKHDAIFEPEFPATCPFITAVGGTTNLADETGATKQTISGLASVGYTASGGGFSNLFPRPNYQIDVVDSYVSRHVPKSYETVSGYGTGRGIPDVSAFSTNFPTVVSSVTLPIGGTSASTPLWAAIITLLNDYEASKGRPNLGFLNLWLYGLDSGLKDITTGGNNVGGCNLLAGCTLPKTLGYNATEGWDPVTGLGSPIFKELRQSLDALAGD